MEGLQSIHAENVSKNVIAIPEVQGIYDLDTDNYDARNGYIILQRKPERFD